MKSHLQNYFRQTLMGLAALLCATSALGQGGDYLYVMRGSTLAYAKYDGANSCPSWLSLGSSSYGVSVDNANGKIYYSLSGGSIGVMNLDGSSANNTLITGLSLPQGIAFDGVNNKLYWAEAGRIAVADLSTSSPSVTTLVTFSGGDAMDVAIDQANGRLYYTRLNTGNIGMYDVNASTNYSSYISTGGSPFCVALDLTNNKLYWSDFPNNKIGEADFSGATPALNTSFITASYGPLGIDVDPTNGVIMWSNNNGTIGKSNLAGTSITDPFLSNYTNAYAVDFGVAPVVPEVNVQGNNVSIADGDLSPTTGDNTDFGTGVQTRSFVIQNSGTAALNIGTISISGANAGDFSVSALPATSAVATNGSTSFSVTFNPSGGGLRTATIHIANGDCDESSYDFAIEGTGTPGAALHFDGVNDYVDLGTSFGNFGTGDFTLETWFKTTMTSSGNIPLISKRGSCTHTDFWNLSMSSGKLFFELDNSNTNYIFITSPLAYNDGQWHHVACTRSGTAVKMYVDGSLVVSGTSAGITNLSNTTSVQIGRSACGNFAGTLDEVRIWGTARTCEEIAQRRNCELAPANETGLLAYYKFNQGAVPGNNAGTTTLFDATANGHDGTLSTGASGFALTGSTSNWVTPGGVTSGNACTGAVTAPEIALSGGTTPTPINDGATSAAASAANGTSFGPVATNSSSSRTYTIQNTGTSTLTLSGITKDLTTTGNGDFTFTGLPASLAASATATFTVTFTPTALGARSTIIHIASDDCDEADYDFAVSGTGATPGAALAFGGVGTINCGNSASLNSSAAVTVEGWIKLNSTATQRVVFKESSTVGRSWELSIHGGGKLYWELVSNGQTYSLFGNTTLATGTWYHAAATFDQNVLKVYLNGVLDGSKVAQGQPLSGNNGNMYVSHPGFVFNGTMDEIRVWNVARTCDQISQRRGCELLPANEPNLVAYYQFNQGIASGSNAGATTLIDATSNGNNGTLANFALTGSTSNWVTPGGVTSGIACSGTVAAPEINIASGSAPTSIPDGKTALSTTDNTQFGSTAVGTPVTNTYTIENNGTNNLTVSGVSLSGANANQFTVSTISPASPVTPSSTATFTVTFNPTTVGLKNATITVNNNDCDEDVYDFAIQGDGTCATPTAFAVTGGGCTGGSGAAIGLAGSETGVSYQLKNGATNVGSPVGGNGAAISFPNQNTAATYTVIATRTLGACTNNMTGSAVVNQTPNAVATPSSQAICNGTAMTPIGLSGSLSGTTYNWTRDNTTNVTGIATSGAGNISSPSLSNTLTGTNIPAATTTFTITPTVNGCTGSAITATVTVKPTPDLAQPSNQTVCANTATAAVNFSGATANTIYSWTNNSPSIGLAGTGTGNIGSFTATNTTNAPVTATVTVSPMIGTAFAYISNAGSNNVSVINTATNAVVGSPITVGATPAGVAWSPDGSKVYVANSFGTTVSVISTASNTVTANYTVSTSPATPYGLAASPDGSKVYVSLASSTNLAGTTIAVINTATSAISSITVGSGPGFLAFKPDGSRLYVANSGTNDVSVIDPATNAVVSTVTGVSNPTGLTVSPDGSRVYAASNAGNIITLISTVSNTVTGTITLPTNGVRGLVTSNDGSKLYVAAFGSNVVYVVNTATNVITHTITVGNAPRGIDITPDGTKVLVANSGSNTVSVINTALNTVTATINVGTSPYAHGQFINRFGSCSGLSKTFTITVNPSPVIYAVTGGGAYCAGGTGKSIGLSNSQTGVNYQLKLNGNDMGSPVAGTGSAMPNAFPNQTTAGTYTVVATQTAAGNCTATMSGSATITINPLPTVAPITGTTTVCINNTTQLSNATSGGVWSSNSSSASVDGTGLVTGNAVGNATITYTFTNGNGCTNASTTTVTVDPRYIITSSVTGANGNISPLGTTDVCSGTNQTYAITASTAGNGYHIAAVKVDGTDLSGSAATAAGVGTGSGSYTFSNVTATHNIDATFAPNCTPPVVSCNNSSFSQGMDANLCTAVVSYTPATATGTTPSITYSQASGSAFNKGITTVTATATNACGTDQCSFDVTVTDNQAPTLACPTTGLTMNVVANTCAADYTIASPISDNCTGATWGANFYTNAFSNPPPAFISGIAAGTSSGPISFNRGSTTVILTGTDGTNNATTCSFTVTVIDNEVPTITAPATVNANADASQCYATIPLAGLGTPTAADNCAYILTNNAPANNQYPVGSTIVTWSVTDGSNPPVTATQTVTVTDNEAPVFTAPLPATKTMSGYCQPVAANLPIPPTTDNCGVASTVATVNGSVIDPATYMFPGGTTTTNTTVVWTATDIHGKTATVNQTVTVVPAVVTATSAVSPLYPMAGQEKQTIYLGYPSCAQTVDIDAAGSGGTGSYTFSWAKTGCNPSANTGTITSTGNTSSKLSFTGSSADACVIYNDNVHIFTATLTDGKGCVATTFRKVNVVNAWTGTTGSSNVQLCHRVAVRGGSVTQMMSMPQSQVSAHLAHGDYLGNCPVFTGVKTIPAEELGIEEEQEVKVYPNPTTGIFILELSHIHHAASILITDVQGKTVATKEIAKDATPTATFDLSYLARGMYLIQVRDGELNYRTKIIVQ